ncbi:MAG: methyltransferase domain-containing protein, partial [Ignavibacteriae bacterium]|nr:methyltransferase domain-containing protein [Ignavibacteriota bacterium]
MKIDFENLSMSEIVGLVNDPNRCPGAANSIRRVLQEAMLPSNSLIVEIGSNTGFTSIEFALRKPDSKVVGIDVNKSSVEHAKQKAKKHGVKNVTFYVDDATDIKKVKPKSADL